MREPATSIPGTDLLAYYRARAAEYERVYDKPERQADIATLRGVVAAFGRDHRVLEVACGTGYWTAVIATTAAHIVAVDRAAETLAQAATKQLPANRVRFVEGDAFDLAAVPGDFDAALVAFWWSHIPLADVARFLSGLHARLSPGARVLLIDNRYVEGSNWPITRTDPVGNTYQHRVLSSGAPYEVLKNFPSVSQVRDALASAGACDVDLRELPHYWYASYEVAILDEHDSFSR